MRGCLRNGQPNSDRQAPKKSELLSHAITPARYITMIHIQSPTSVVKFACRLLSSELACFGASRSSRFARQPSSGPSAHTLAEIRFIVCNQCQPCNHGMRSDPETVVSDHLASRFQRRPNRSVGFDRRFRQGERWQKMHELTQPLKRPNPLLALGGAIEQLAVGNDESAASQ